MFRVVDDARFHTSWPGRDTRRRAGYMENAQRAFYSGYFGEHGLKVQTVTLRNRLFGSVFVTPLRIGDTGL